MFHKENIQHYGLLWSHIDSCTFYITFSVLECSTWKHRADCRDVEWQVRIKDK